MNLDIKVFFQYYKESVIREVDCRNTNSNGYIFGRREKQIEHQN